MNPTQVTTDFLHKTWHYVDQFTVLREPSENLNKQKSRTRIAFPEWSVCQSTQQLNEIFLKKFPLPQI